MIFKKTTVSTLLALLSSSIERVIFVSNWSFFYHIDVLIVVTPLTTLTVLILTTMISFYGTKILISLYGTKRFHQASTQRDNGSMKGEYTFFSITVIVMMMLQVVKLIVHLTNISIQAVMSKELNECMILEMTVISSECIENIQNKLTTNTRFLKETWTYFIEYAVILLMIIKKKACYQSKRSE